MDEPARRGDKMNQLELPSEVSVTRSAVWR